MEKEERKGIDWIALAITFLLNTHFFYAFGASLGVMSGAGGIGILAAGLCFICALLKRTSFSRRRFPIFLLLNIVIFPAFTLANWRTQGITTMTSLRLGLFAVFPMVVFLFDFNPKKVIDYTCYFVPLTLIIQKTLFSTVGSFDQMEMGYSNAIAHFCVACLMEFAYYRKENKGKWYMKICLLIGLYLAIKLIFKGTRGTILTLAVACLLFYITGFDKDDILKRQGWKKILLFLVIFLFIYNFNTILELAERFFEHFGLSLPSVIQKTVDAVKSKDLTHGRNRLAEFTKLYIRQKPMFGYGSMTFKHYNKDFAYPHNCILQLMFENGIAGSLYIIISLFINIFMTIFPRKTILKDELLGRQLIMLTALPMLFVSNEMWITPAFWMFLAFSYRIRARREDSEDILLREES